MLWQQQQQQWRRAAALASRCRQAARPAVWRRQGAAPPQSLPPLSHSSSCSSSSSSCGSRPRPEGPCPGSEREPGGRPARVLRWRGSPRAACAAGLCQPLPLVRASSQAHSVGPLVPVHSACRSARPLLAACSEEHFLSDLIAFLTDRQVGGCRVVQGAPCLPAVDHAEPGCGSVLCARQAQRAEPGRVLPPCRAVKSTRAPSQRLF